MTDHPERFEGMTACVLWDETRGVQEDRRITGVRRQGDAVVLALEGCATPEAAAALTGRLVAVDEADALPLAPGHFYPWQLVGARVVTEDGRDVGAVTGIESGGGQDRWIVRGAARDHAIPAVPEIVLDVDLAARRVVIRPPEGLLEL
jgi:16S rRNA processing protein RimM